MEKGGSGNLAIRAVYSAFRCYSGIMRNTDNRVSIICMAREWVKRHPIAQILCKRNEGE